MSALSVAVEKCLSQMSLSSLQIWRVRSLHLEKPKRILRPTAVDAIGVCARSTARLTHTHLTPLHASHVQLADIAAFPVAANFNRTAALATVRSGRCPTCPTSGRPSPRPRAARSSQRRAPRVKPLGLPAEQAAYAAEKKRVRSARQYALESAAKERAIVFVTAILEPISGNGPCGTFTLAQLITLEFCSAYLLPSHLSEVTLTKPHSTINASAVQKLASMVKADKAFESMQALRIGGEPSVTDFVTLHLRCSHAAEMLSDLLQSYRQQERARHPHCATVLQLPSMASLLDIVRAASLASKPRMGRPSASFGTPGDGSISIAQNWADGGYTVNAMQKRTHYDHRRINVSQKETQGDVLEGAGLIVCARSHSNHAKRVLCAQPRMRGEELECSAQATLSPSRRCGRIQARLGAVGARWLLTGWGVPAPRSHRSTVLRRPWLSCVCASRPSARSSCRTQPPRGCTQLSSRSGMTAAHRSSCASPSHLVMRAPLATSRLVQQGWQLGSRGCFRTELASQLFCTSTLPGWSACRTSWAVRWLLGFCASSRGAE